MLRRLTVEAAARHLGLSQQTVKRRLKRGTLRGEQEPTPTGFRWYVVVDTPDTSGDTPPDVSGTPAGTPADTLDTPRAALASQRAQEMAEYTERLLAPLYGRLEAQAELIGALKERLAAAEARVAELEAPAPETESAPSPGGEARRWWQRLLWG